MDRKRYSPSRSYSRRSRTGTPTPRSLVSGRERWRSGERLRQSILKRAFEGRLVPQDPENEPASVLLERIRENREGQAEIAIADE